VAGIPDVHRLEPGIFLLVKTPASIAPTRPPGAGLGDLFGFLLTLLALVIAWKLAVPRPAMPVATLPVAACNVQRESCQLTLGDATRIDLRILERPIAPNQPFTIEGHVADSAVRLVAAEVHGIDVEVGTPPSAFSGAGNDTYRAMLNLPFCTTSRTTWQMTILLTIDGRDLKWPLQFQTETVGLHG
jgi:hypothetical protein